MTKHFVFVCYSVLKREWRRTSDTKWNNNHYASNSRHSDERLISCLHISTHFSMCGGGEVNDLINSDLNPADKLGTNWNECSALFPLQGENPRPERSRSRFSSAAPSSSSWSRAASWKRVHWINRNKPLMLRFLLKLNSLNEDKQLKTNRRLSPSSCLDFCWKLTYDSSI